MPATIPDISASVPEDGRVFSPLRIVQVVNVRWFNATAWYALFLSRLLRDAGHDVRVLGLADTQSFAKAQDWGLEPIPLALNSSNPLVIAKVTRQIIRLTSSFAPHVVNCHRGEGFFLWGVLKHRSPFALVRTRGDQRAPRNNLPNRLLHAQIADAVIATNTRTADQLRALGVGGDRLHTILGGVDTGAFYPDPGGRERMRAAWGLETNDVAVGILGRFDRVKGHEDLMRAVALLREKGRKNLRLVLAGFPTNSVSENDVRAMLDRTGLSSSAVITGRVEDVRATLNGFDVGVVASIGSETIARAALEIMACGVPLVGTDVGVMPDLIGPDAMVPAGDPASLADRLDAVIGNRSLREQLLRVQARTMAALGGQEFATRTLAVYAQAMIRAGIEW